MATQGHQQHGGRANKLLHVIHGCLQCQNSRGGVGQRVKIKREKTGMLTPNKKSATNGQIIKVYSASLCL
jgi:hypothetical protein